MKRILFFSFAGIGLLLACGSSKTVVVSGPPDGDDAGDAAVVLEAGPGTMCTSARNTLLTPINKVSTGEVATLSDDGTTKLIYIDASAGGINVADTNPRIYVNLAAVAAVNVTDVTATSSMDWDLALKRYVIYSNSGDSGPGVGGAVEIDKAYTAVTAADLASAMPAAESFFDAACNPKLDVSGAVQTTFSNWYDYDQATDIPTPDPDRTFLVRGGTGSLYKVGIKAYDALADGGSRNNEATGYFLIQVSAVTQ